MENIRWKNTNNYTIVSLNTTGLTLRDKIIELGAVKVRNDLIVDTFYQKINPNIKTNKEKREKYIEYINFPTFSEIAPKYLKFVGKDSVVGWCVDFHIEHIEKELGKEFKKCACDVFWSQHRIYKNYTYPVSLENTYNCVFSHARDWIEYDYNDVIDKCICIKQIYDSQKYSNLYQSKAISYEEYRKICDESYANLHHIDQFRRKSA